MPVNNDTLAGTTNAIKSLLNTSYNRPTYTSVTNPQLLSLDNLYNQLGVGAPDLSNIQKMYQNAATAQYQAAIESQKEQEKTFYNSLAGIQNNALDTIRNSLGTNSGANAGMQTAAMLSAILGTQSSSLDSLNSLIGGRKTIDSEYSANMAAAIKDAQSYYDTLVSQGMTLDRQLYNDMIQQLAAELDYNAGINTDMAGVDANWDSSVNDLIEQLMGEYSTGETGATGATGTYKPGGYSYKGGTSNSVGITPLQTQIANDYDAGRAARQANDLLNQRAANASRNAGLTGTSPLGNTGVMSNATNGLGLVQGQLLSNPSAVPVNNSAYYNLITKPSANLQSQTDKNDYLTKSANNQNSRNAVVGNGKSKVNNTLLRKAAVAASGNTTGKSKGSINNLSTSQQSRVAQAKQSTAQAASEAALNSAAAKHSSAESARVNAAQAKQLAAQAASEAAAQAATRLAVSAGRSSGGSGSSGSSRGSSTNAAVARAAAATAKKTGSSNIYSSGKSNAAGAAKASKNSVGKSKGSINNLSKSQQARVNQAKASTAAKKAASGNGRKVAKVTTKRPYR